VVTGASRGLGLGIASQLAGAGYDVIALARQKTKPVTDAIAEAKRAKHGALHFVSFDLGEVGEIPGLVKGLRKDFGPLVILAVSGGARSTREASARSSVATSSGGECP